VMLDLTTCWVRLVVRIGALRSRRLIHGADSQTLGGGDL
jgi:hypothetical protein